MANTVILKWNPAISSTSLLAFLTQIIEDDAEGDWSVHDYDKIRSGDIFYMLKVGKGQTGIVMRGTITSDPGAGGDWSNRGRVVHYCDYGAQIMINPDTFQLLTEKNFRRGSPASSGPAVTPGRCCPPNRPPSWKRCG